MIALRFAGLVACTVALVSTYVSPLAAQKSKDTVRIAVNEPYPQIDAYHYPQTEASFLYNTVFETLIAYDETKKSFVPWISKSWNRIDDRTLEFEIHDDIVFHSGNKLTADDVIHSLNYARDPKVQMPFKGRYLTIGEVEKLGYYKLRVVFKTLFADDLMHIAYRSYVYDSKVHTALSDPTDYGRKSPIGTGPYKVTEFERTQGVSLQRFDDAKKHYFTRSPIKYVRATFLPDEQARLANLITGNVDVLYNVSADNAREVASRPNVAVTAIPSVTVTYMGLDVAGRTKRTELKDPRVRQAIYMAIDRNAIRKSIIPGGEVSDDMSALCFDSMITCAYSTKPPAYDPAGAKKLLAEAGFANGFDLTIDTHTAVKPLGEAISGYLRAVGIRAEVNSVLQTVFFKRRSEGEFQAIVAYAPARNFPEGTYILDNLFGVPADDYIRDDILTKAIADGSAVHDVAKRRAAHTIAFDRINNLFGFLPIGSLPAVYAHSKEVRIEKHPLGGTREMVSNLIWQ